MMDLVYVCVCFLWCFSFFGCHFLFGLGLSVIFHCDCSCLISNSNETCQNKLNIIEQERYLKCRSNELAFYCGSQSAIQANWSISYADAFCPHHTTQIKIQNSEKQVCACWMWFSQDNTAFVQLLWNLIYRCGFGAISVIFIYVHEDFDCNSTEKTDLPSIFWLLLVDWCWPLGSRPN